MLTKEELAKKALEHHKSELARISRDEYAVFKGRLKPFVEAVLKKRCDPSTFSEMPVVASINMMQKIVKQRASIYRNYPKRSITGADEELFNQAYRDISADVRLGRANKIYKTSNQAFLYVIHKDGKLKSKVLCKHHVYVEHEDGEPISYVIIGGDTSKPENTVLTVWQKNANFNMDGNGKVLSEDTATALPGRFPFIDISDEDEKDFSFYVDSDPALLEFTIEFNAIMSDLLYILRQQGFAVGVISGPEDTLKKLTTITVGPSKFVKLPTDYKVDPGDSESKAAAVDMKFINPNPNLTGSIEAISALLSAFLTSLGVDPKTISFKGEGNSFASGWERLLALIEKFEATKDDFEIFYRVEYELFDLVRAWIKAANGSIGNKYKGVISDNAVFEVEFAGPEMTETAKEKDDRLAFREDRQWITKAEAMSEALGITLEDAESRLSERAAEESNEQGTDKKDIGA